MLWVIQLPAATTQRRDHGYDCDDLGRLTAADYDDGTFFHHTYDAVGNRLTEETDEATSTYTYDIANRLTNVDGTAYTWDANGNLLSDGTSTYTYDIANRLTNVDGTAYTWDANGNLLSDGTSTYTYDAANRLVGLVQGADTYAYVYNGLGNRLSQTVNGDSINYVFDNRK